MLLRRKYTAHPLALPQTHILLRSALRPGQPGYLTPQSGVTDPDLCMCLSNMYLASSSIPADHTYMFPHTLGSLRVALGKANEILTCKKCNEGTETSAVRQNTNFVLTLVSSLGCAFDRLLRYIDAEAKAVSESGLKKQFAMGDTSPHLMHLHTGTDDCPMRFDVELDGTEWRKFAFRATKAQIDDKRDGRLTLESLVDALQTRQQTWHAAVESGGVSQACRVSHASQDPSCLSLARNVKMMIEDMPT